MENGKHVLCEKTVTLNAAQWKELACLAREKQLFLMEAMWTKCLPAFQQAVSGCRKDVSVQCGWSRPKCLCSARPQSAPDFRELGGGALLDVGSILWPWRLPAWGTARRRSRPAPISAELVLTMMQRFCCNILMRMRH